MRWADHAPTIAGQYRMTQEEHPRSDHEQPLRHRVNDPIEPIGSRDPPASKNPAPDDGVKEATLTKVQVNRPTILLYPCYVQLVNEILLLVVVLPRTGEGKGWRASSWKTLTSLSRKALPLRIHHVEGVPILP